MPKKRKLVNENQHSVMRFKYTKIAQKVKKNGTELFKNYYKNLQFNGKLYEFK